MNRESEGKSSGIPHLAKNERDVGHPYFVREPECEGSVAAEGDDGIDARGAAGRKIACDERYRDQEQEHRREG